MNRDKELWLINVTESWFYENPNLIGSEVAGYLEYLLLHEFDLFVEDGSLDEVGPMLCDYYALCAKGNEAEILDKLRSLPRCDLSLCRCEDEEDQNLHRWVG